MYAGMVSSAIASSLTGKSRPAKFQSSHVPGMAASSRASFRLLEENRPSGRLTAYDREIPFWYVPFDVLRVFDLPQLLAASHAGGLMIDPLYGDGPP